MKIGANGSLSIAMAANGDVQISFTESDTDTSESLVIAVHPAVVQAALVKALGGGALASGIVNFTFAELPTLIAAGQAAGV